MQKEKKAKLIESVRLKVNPERSLKEKLDDCQLDLQRVLKMNTPKPLSKIDTAPINSYFLESNPVFKELIDHIKSWNSRVDAYRKSGLFFKCQNALNTIFIELGIHLREISQTFNRDIQASYLKNVKTWFEEIYFIFSEEFQAAHKKKLPLEDPSDIIERIELTIASKTNDNNKINELIQRKKNKAVDVNTPSNKSLDQFKKFLPRPQTQESQVPPNILSLSVQVNKQRMSVTSQEPRSRNDSEQQTTTNVQNPTENNSMIGSHQTSQRALQPIAEYTRSCQTCIPQVFSYFSYLYLQLLQKISKYLHSLNRAHSYGHIPLQSQVRFISKDLDEKTQFRLHILKQKMNKEQEKQGQQQLAKFMQNWGKERRQQIQFKNARNEMTFQCNDFGRLRYQKKELQQNLKRDIEIQETFQKAHQDFLPETVLNQQNNHDLHQDSMIMIQNGSFLTPNKPIGEINQINEFTFQTKNTALQSTENTSHLASMSAKQDLTQAKKKQQNLDDSELEQKIQKNLFNNDSDDENAGVNEQLPYRQKSQSKDITEELASQIQIYSYINQQSQTEKVRLGDIYKKYESFESSNNYGQEDRSKNPSFLIAKSPGKDSFENENNEENIEYQKQNTLLSQYNPFQMKNKSQIEGNNPQQGSAQNSQYFRTASSFFPNNNQLPTMETFNQIHSRQSSSQHKTRNNLMSDTLQTFQLAKQKSQMDQGALPITQKIQSVTNKQPVVIDLFGLQETKQSQLYETNQGQNHLNTHNQLMNEIKRNKINQLIQTKGKIINLSTKQLPIVSQKNIKSSKNITSPKHFGNFLSNGNNDDNELTEEVIRERLANSIMQYSTKIKAYQDSKRQINTKSKQSITDKQVTNDQIDEITKVRSVLSRNNIIVKAQNLKASLLTPILPVPKFSSLQNKSSFLPEQGAQLFSMDDD